MVWAAGFLDGEGCFSIKRRTRERNGELLIDHQPWIACGMSHTPQTERAIRKLQELFGGKFYTWHSTGNKKDVISWSICARQAQKCARLLRDYLIVKREHADILIEYYEKCKQDRWNGGGISTEIRDLRESYFWKLRALNTKGRLRLQRPSEEPSQVEMKHQSELNSNVERQPEVVVQVT